MIANGWDPEGRPTYDPETDTFHTTHDPATPGSLTNAVISLVAIATENDPETMVSLYEAVDTDALENLFQSQAGQSTEVAFRYCGCAVTVRSDGEVEVSPLRDDG